MTRRRAPIPVADLLDRFTRDAQPASLLAELQRRWPEAVGETIAGWSAPVSEKGGVVVVECDDSVIAHELEMIKSELLSKLSETLVSGVPRELRFRAR